MSGSGAGPFGIMGFGTALTSPSALPLSVANLSVRSHCAGRRIDLSWANAVGVARTKIVRRQKNWIFDLTDAHDVVYDGTAISAFSDTGVVCPCTNLSGDVAVGDVLLNVASSAGFAPGDMIRVDQLQGTPAYDIGASGAAKSNEGIPTGYAGAAGGTGYILLRLYGP